MIVCQSAAVKRRASKALWQVGFCAVGFVRLPMCLTCCVGFSVSYRKEIANKICRFVIYLGYFIAADANIYFAVTKSIIAKANIEIADAYIYFAIVKNILAVAYIYFAVTKSIIAICNFVNSDGNIYFADAKSIKVRANI